MLSVFGLDQTESLLIDRLGRTVDDVSYCNPQNISVKAEPLTHEALNRFLSLCSTEARCITDEVSSTTDSLSDISIFDEIDSVTSESSSLNAKIELPEIHQTKQLKPEDSTSTIIEFLRSLVTTHE